MLKEDQREEKTGCDQLRQPCAKSRMNSAAPLPAQRGALSSGQPLTPPASCEPKETIAAVPLAERVLQLSSRGIGGQGGALKADMNVRGGLEKSEKNVLCPVTAVQSSCTSVFLGGSLGTYCAYRRGTLNGSLTRSPTNATP